MSNNSIWLIKRTITGATAPGQSGAKNDGNEVVFIILQSSSITGVSPSDGLTSYTQDTRSERASYLSVEMQSVYSTAPTDWVSKSSEAAQR